MKKPKKMMTRMPNPMIAATMVPTGTTSGIKDKGNCVRCTVVFDDADHLVVNLGPDYGHT